MPRTKRKPIKVKPKRKPRKKAARKKASKRPSVPKSVPETESYNTSFASLSTLSGLLQSIPEDPSIKKRRMSLKTVSGNLQEHLDSFILIGYTPNGDPVQMMWAPTPRDIDSLSTNLQKFILDTYNGPPSHGGI